MFVYSSAGWHQYHDSSPFQQVVKGTFGLKGRGKITVLVLYSYKALGFSKPKETFLLDAT